MVLLKGLTPYYINKNEEGLPAIGGVHLRFFTIELSQENIRGTEDRATAPDEKR